MYCIGYSLIHHLQIYHVTPKKINLEYIIVQQVHYTCLLLVVPFGYNNSACFKGILAAVRPCGIIVLLAELFTSESKSQVYANLHEYLRKHSAVSQSLGEQSNHSMD